MGICALPGEINVADYGITPASADNSPAMAELLATLTPYTALNFPAGTYLFTEPIAPNVPVAIRGLGGLLDSSTGAKVVRENIS